MDTARAMLKTAEARLRKSTAIEHWPADREHREAVHLMAFALGDEEPSEEFDDLDRKVPAKAKKRFKAYVERRADGEPVACIIGWTTFHGIRVGVRRGAFVPRQSSELMADLAVRRLRRRRQPVAVDLATGVGPVALAVAHAIPGA